jgi:integrase
MNQQVRQEKKKEISDFRTHSLRHCNASAILSMGCDEKDEIVMEGLGLKSPIMECCHGRLNTGPKR